MVFYKTFFKLLFSNTAIFLIYALPDIPDKPRPRYKSLNPGMEAPSSSPAYRIWKIDIHNFLDTARSRAHDNNLGCQNDGLFHIMGDEETGLLLSCHVFVSSD